MGRLKREWQDTQTVLAYFGPSQKEAIIYYEKFVQDGIALGRRPELVGGGLVHSAGDWFQVLSLRRKNIRVASDAIAFPADEPFIIQYAEAMFQSCQSRPGSS